jgi:hypothetical protein
MNMRDCVACKDERLDLHILGERAKGSSAIYVKQAQTYRILHYTTCLLPSSR